MAEFKMSKELQGLIAQKEEAVKKQEEKQANIEALNNAQQVLLAKKSSELQEIINKYAEDPSEELETQLTELEKEVAQLQAKVAGSNNRNALVYTSDTSAIQSLKSQINALAQAEYLAHFNANKEEIYNKIGESKTAYLNAMAELNDLQVTTNREYIAVTGSEIGVAYITDSDFNYQSSSYRPFFITQKEMMDALKDGKPNDPWNRPYVNQLNN